MVALLNSMFRYDTFHYYENRTNYFNRAAGSSLQPSSTMWTITKWRYPVTLTWLPPAKERRRKERRDKFTFPSVCDMNEIRGRRFGPALFLDERFRIEKPKRLDFLLVKNRKIAQVSAVEHNYDKHQIYEAPHRLASGWQRVVQRYRIPTNNSSISQK